MNKTYTDFVNLKVAPVTKDTCSRLCEDAEIVHSLTGLASEVGELQDAFKKYWFYGQEMDHDNVEEELGDIYFYFTKLLSACGMDLEEVMHANCRKLQARYAKGFTTDESIARADKSDNNGMRNHSGR